jgi:transposase
MFVPPYSPELNLIDKLLDWLKWYSVNTVFFPTLSRVRIYVQNFIRHINKVSNQTIKMLCIRL